LAAKYEIGIRVDTLTFWKPTPMFNIVDNLNALAEGWAKYSRRKVVHFDYSQLAPVKDDEGYMGVVMIHYRDPVKEPPRRIGLDSEM
jgi:hypothetical protein